jgi:sugar diacid utilization regulator
MRIPVSIASSAIAVLLATSPVFAEQHVVDRAALQSAIAAETASEEANRQLVAKALQRTDVRDMAARFGLDVVQAEQALASMSGEQLQQLAQPARALADHAGGDQVVVISITTLLLIIIVVLLVAD